MNGEQKGLGLMRFDHGAIAILSGLEYIIFQDMVYPTIVLNALPKGLIGLVLARFGRGNIERYRER